MRAGERDPFKNGPPKNITIPDLHKCNAARLELRQKFADTFNALGVDAVLCPTLALPSCPHRKLVIRQSFNLVRQAEGCVRVVKVSRNCNAI